MKVIDGGVTAPIGYQAAGIQAGIKKDKKDMALVYSESACEAAGVFTRDLVQAAPVKWDRMVVQSGAKCHAVVVNSGVAQMPIWILYSLCASWLSARRCSWHSGNYSELYRIPKESAGSG